VGDEMFDWDMFWSFCENADDSFNDGEFYIFSVIDNDGNE